MSFYTKKVRFIIVLLLIVLNTQIGFGQKNKLDNKELEKTMRGLWKGEEPDYQRDWLIVGGFPAEDMKALEHDYLFEFGGEKGVVYPREGQSVILEDGSVLKWKRCHTDTPVLDFKREFEGGRVENAVAYAYVKVNRKKKGKVYLSLGSDDGVKIWLNGKEIHNNPVFRGANPDDDWVEADMKSGDNHLLFKVFQGTGDWGLILRTVDARDEITMFPNDMRFNIAEVNKDKKTITIKSTKNREFDVIQLNFNLRVFTAGGGNSF